MHRDEVADLVERRGGQAYAVVGPRQQGPTSMLALFRRLVPDLARRDVYICGPGGFTDSVVVSGSEPGRAEGTYPP